MFDGVTRPAPICVSALPFLRSRLRTSSNCSTFDDVLTQVDAVCQGDWTVVPSRKTLGHTNTLLTRISPLEDDNILPIPTGDVLAFCETPPKLKVGTVIVTREQRDPIVVRLLVHMQGASLAGRCSRKDDSWTEVNEVGHKTLRRARGQMLGDFYANHQVEGPKPRHTLGKITCDESPDLQPLLLQVIAVNS